jgi:hypothetical protein
LHYNSTVMSKYMMVLIISGIVPLVAGFWPPFAFWRSWRRLLYRISLVVIIFGGWDVRYFLGALQERRLRYE